MMWFKQKQIEFYLVKQHINLHCREILGILRFADAAAILILPPGHPIMIIEINIFLCDQLISMFIMGCPGGKINMAAVSSKRSMIKQTKEHRDHHSSRLYLNR